MLNLNYFSVKSIMIIFSYYHRSRLYYGLACFADQKNNIQKVERILLSKIKRMLKFTNFTNSERLKVSLGIPDLEISLYERLEILKEKYYNIFKED